MSIDPLVASATIGFFGIVVGISGYAFQNWLIQKNARERREFMIKRKKYENLVRLMVHGIHVVVTKKQSTSIEFKEQVDEVTNLLWLYASDEVLKTLRLLLSSDIEKTDTKAIYKSLLLAMRNDLKIKTSLGISDIDVFRVT